jgi:hypothetical protein
LNFPRCDENTATLAYLIDQSSVKEDAESKMLLDNS